ncbi:hypothetical protein ACFLTS_03495 [Chloroflexota bacterium]
MATVFYSWQSDAPNNVNRGFIKDALEKAIENIGKSLSLEEALRLDQDTSGVPGTPDITNTILSKIEGCSVFIPDLTYVAKTDEGEKVPNPNVLIELGYAMKAISDSQIILVMNEAFGSPDKDELPFDLKHRRWPIRYNLPPNAVQEQKQEQKKNLTSQLERAITTIIESGVLIKSEPTKSEVQPKWKESSFLNDAEKIFTSYIPKGNSYETKNTIWVNGAQAFLRFIPTIPFAEKTPKQIKDLGNANLIPMGYSIHAFSIEINHYGMIVFEQKEGNGARIALSITQVFRNGEIWGMNGDLLRGDKTLDGEQVRSYIPDGAVEQLFIQTFNSYVTYAKTCLKLIPPIKFIAGLSGIEDLALSNTGKLCIEDQVIDSGIIKDYDSATPQLLLPLMERIWESCGLSRKRLIR